MIDTTKLKWTREPEKYEIGKEKIVIVTAPKTDLWQRTYYGFSNDNAPALQFSTRDKYFSFTCKTQFDSKRRFDQCGIIMYLDRSKPHLPIWKYRTANGLHINNIGKRFSVTDFDGGAIQQFDEKFVECGVKFISDIALSLVL